MQRIFIEADSIAGSKMSGIGHATLEIVRAFDALASKEDLSVTVIVPWEKRSYISKYNLKNVRVRCLPPPYKYVNYALTRLPFGVPVDLWFGRGTYIFPNYKNWSVPFSRSITFIHDMAFKKFPETIHPKTLPYLNKNIPRWMKRTDVIATISKASEDELKEFFPEYRDKVEVVYLGVDEGTFHPRTKAEVQKVKHDHQLPDSYFLALGNLEPRKNLVKMLDAYKIYHDQTENPHALLFVGGDGWQNAEILAKIATMQAEGYAVERSRTYIPDEDLPALYTGSVALLQLSLHEGFGLAPLQAQACGVPVIASDLPVFKEIVQKGITYVAGDDEKDIARAMERVGRAQSAPRQAVPTQLTWQRTVSQLLAIITQLREGSK